MNRRHPDYDHSRRREHDVDSAKEIQHLKEQLMKKDNEVQLVRAQKVCRISAYERTFSMTILDG